ncbi:MAG: PQQ-dependent sugar dehydrogenase [Flavobacteriales bacterium]
MCIRSFLPGLLLLTTPLFAQTSFQVGEVTVNITTVADGLDVPWDLVLGPDGQLWFTEANGNVYRMDLVSNTLDLVHTVEDVVLAGFTAGLHSMAFHPDFTNQPYVYLHYMNATSTSVVERFLFDAETLSFGPGSGHLLNVTIPGGASHNGSRMVADEAGNFILCVGDRMSGSGNVQDLEQIEGKFLRFDPLGGIPADNPIPGSYVYNWGHRNPQGLVRASTGIWYNSAHGQSNDDEVNIVLPGRNYGWPTVLGLCDTPAEQAYCTANDVVEPIHEFTTEVVAPAGLDHYAHTAIPGWQNSLLVATLRGRSLWQLQLDETGTSVIAATPYLEDSFGRLRDVLVLPDGRVLVCTSNRDWAGDPTPADDRIMLLTADLSTASSRDAQGVTGPSPRAFVDDHAALHLPAGSHALRMFDPTGRLVAQRTAAQGIVDLGGLVGAPGYYRITIAGADDHWDLPVIIGR